MRSCRHWVPQVSEVGKWVFQLWGWRMSLCHAPGPWGGIRKSEGFPASACLPLDHHREAGEGSVPFPAPGADQPAQGAEFKSTSLQLWCGWGGAITTQGQQAEVWHLWQCPGDWKALLCTAILLGTHLCGLHMLILFCLWGVCFYLCTDAWICWFLFSRCCYHFLKLRSSTSKTKWNVRARLKPSL